MANLTERHRIEILMIIGYGDRRRTQEEVCVLFNEMHPERRIVHSTVSKILRKFNETGSVKNLAKSGRPKKVTDGDKALDILLSVEENPHSSTRQLAMDHNISQKSICNLMKAVKWHPYKVHLLQELSEDDFDRRIQFAETLNDMLDQNPNIVNKIVFSDEATFCLNGNVNRHNSHYWAKENPHWMIQHHTQHPQKVNVWAGISNGRLIGPFFIDGNLNAAMYLNLLQNEIIPACGILFPGEGGGIQNDILFQQDGAPAHYGREVVNYLNHEFPGRWIGRRGSIEWPPRSPDLNPLDFFLWGYLKWRVYKDRPRDLEDLKRRIRQEMQLICPTALLETLNNFKDRLLHCLAVNGGHFEHLLH